MRWGWVSLCGVLLNAACNGGGDDATNLNNNVVNTPPAVNSETPPPPAAAPPPTPELDATDILAFNHLKKAAITSKASAAAIWNEEGNGRSYEINKIPMYFIRRSATLKNERGYLIQHPSPLGKAIANSDFNDTLGVIHRYDDQAQILGDENFSFSEKVAGKDTFVFPYRPASGDAQADEWDPSIPTSDEFFFLLVHEAFHRYQMVEGQWTEYPGWTQDEDKYPLTRETIALALLENAVLSFGLRAVEAKNKEKALELLIAVRKARIALPAMVAFGINFVEKLEMPQELSEGTANYAELQFRLQSKMLPNGDNTLAGISKEIISQLERPKDPTAYMTSDDVRSELAFGRFYASGAAIGVLLDATLKPTTAAGADWRSACKTATSPYQSALLRYPNISGADADAKVTAAKAAHGYDALLIVADKLLALPKGGMSLRRAAALHHHRR